MKGNSKFECFWLLEYTVNLTNTIWNNSKYGCVNKISLTIIVILVGTVLMYKVEKNEPNSEIDSLEDALWWCIATVTTVGYGDVVPVSKIGSTLL